MFYFYSPAVTTVKEPKIDFSLKYSICCWQLKSILLNNYTYSKKVKKKVLASFRYMFILIYTHIWPKFAQCKLVVVGNALKSFSHRKLAGRYIFSIDSLSPELVWVKVFKTSQAMDLESTYTIVVVRNIKVFSTLPRNYKMVYPPISILEQQGEQWQYFHTSVLM